MKHCNRVACFQVPDSSFASSSLALLSDILYRFQTEVADIHSTHKEKRE